MTAIVVTRGEKQPGIAISDTQASSSRDMVATVQIDVLAGALRDHDRRLARDWAAVLVVSAVVTAVDVRLQRSPPLGSTLLDFAIAVGEFVGSIGVVCSLWMLFGILRRLRSTTPPLTLTLASGHVSVWRAEDEVYQEVPVLKVDAFPHWVRMTVPGARFAIPLESATRESLLVHLRAQGVPVVERRSFAASFLHDLVATVTTELVLHVMTHGIVLALVALAFAIPILAFGHFGPWIGCLVLLVEIVSIGALVRKDRAVRAKE